MIATDELAKAEDLIKGSMNSQAAEMKTLEICRWLLSLNDQETTHRIKCYTRGDAIGFCFDRGNDCTSKKIFTAFLTIKRDFTLILKPIKTDFSNLKRYGNYYGFNGGYALSQPIEKFKEPILEAYCKKLKLPKFIKEGNLESVFCQNKEIYETYEKSLLSKKNDLSSNIGEIPTREEVELIYRRITTNWEEIDLIAFKKAIEDDFAKRKKKLRSDWWEITLKNIEEWSKKGQ